MEKSLGSAGLHELRNSTRFSWEEISPTISSMLQNILQQSYADKKTWQSIKKTLFLPKFKINEFGRSVFPRDFYIEQNTFST